MQNVLKVLLVVVIIGIALLVSLVIVDTITLAEAKREGVRVVAVGGVVALAVLSIYFVTRSKPPMA